MANDNILKNRAASDAHYYRNKLMEEKDRLLAAETLLNQLNAENRKLRSMCKAAAAEINDQWNCHCDDDGYGPVNLMSRLEGKLPPDICPGFDDA